MIVTARAVQMALSNSGFNPPMTGVFDQGTLDTFGDFVFRRVPGGGIDIVLNSEEAEISDKVASALFAHDKPYFFAWVTLSAISGTAALYHGYKRNNSLGYSLLWGFFGFLFPIVTPAIAVAQGFGKRKGRK